MELISFKEQTIIIAKDQPDYLSMPAHVDKDEKGIITFCWEITWREKISLLLNGKIWHQVLTFNKSLQPQRLSTYKPFMSKK